MAKTFPKTLGTCADQLYKTRDKRLAAQKVVDKIKAEETALKEYIINTLPKSKASGVAGKLARVTVVTKTEPQVEDWEAFQKYVKKTNQFDLMNRKISAPAIKERWADNKKIPGIKTFNKVTVSINKVK